jgi:predicted histone-like DNA-binding protein
MKNSAQPNSQLSILNSQFSITSMVRYILKQIKIASSRAYGKWFAKNVVEETIDLDGLAEHMSNHNSPYSKGVIKGLLTDMIGCIKELLLEGKNVKIDDLAIFSLGIKNKLAANSEDEFTVSKNVEGVKLRARATGELMSKTLNLEATLKKAQYINGKLTSTDDNVNPNANPNQNQNGGGTGGSDNTNVNPNPNEGGGDNGGGDNPGGGGNDDPGADED